MSLVINNNIPSLNAQGNITKTNVDNSKALERLSSGLRINRAGDDAAGLAISEKLRSQVRGLNQAVRNANDGISLVQTAEGGFNTITNIVQRLRELSVQSASDTNTSADRATLRTEAEQLIAEINRIGNTTEFNTKTLLNGTFSSGKLHIGANFSQSISFTIGDIRASALGTRASVVIMDNSLRKVDEFMHVSRRMRTIALQSAVGGMALSVGGMIMAAAGWLTPVEGAVAQEVIDVAAVLNARRAAVPQRRIYDM